MRGTSLSTGTLLVNCCSDIMREPHGIVLRVAAARPAGGSALVRECVRACVCVCV
jgi:hypothetical protein